MTNFFSKSIMKLRPSDGFLLGTYPVGHDPAGISFDGTYLLVANSGENTVMRVRPADGAALATYRTGKNPLCAISDGTYIWAANFGSDSVSTTNVAASTGGAAVQ